MGNTNSSVRHLQDVLSFWVGGLEDGGDVVAGIDAGEDAPSLMAPHLPVAYNMGNDVGAKAATSSGGDAVSVDVEQQIEKSKSHWSELSEFESGSGDEDVEADNREVFKALQSHPTWGNTFFATFNYNSEKWKSSGSLEIGEKFAEGGQAKLFHAKVYWRNPTGNEWDRELGREWVVKVFKKGTPLRHLQSQWPLGMLQFLAEDAKNWKSRNPKVHPRFYCAVDFGTLLEDGRFAFLMKKEHLDLRSLIDGNMMTLANKNCGPFPKEVVEEIMFEVALGMSWLHSRDIVHRDLKASNVLVKVHDNGHMQCFVADYECSIGVVGTGFFRAPEILKACKDKSVSKRPELFTKASDVYSYAMTCYEILTGKLPFDGHLVNDYVDCVISGKRPEVPEYVEGWIHRLLTDCWQCDPNARPLFEDVVITIVENSERIRDMVKKRERQIKQVDWINWRSLMMNK